MAGTLLIGAAGDLGAKACGAPANLGKVAMNLLVTSGSAMACSASKLPKTKHMIKA
jgi:sugar (pentulose or hexulose) kinase